MFGRKFLAEYSAETNIRQGLPKTKKGLFSNYFFWNKFFRQKKTFLYKKKNILHFWMYFICSPWILSQTILSHINDMHISFMWIGKHWYMYFLTGLPNIRYRPNIRQWWNCRIFVSAETGKSVFGRSLLKSLNHRSLPARHTLSGHY